MIQIHRQMSSETKVPLPLWCLIILLVCFVSFFVYNDTVPADLMESRNLVTAREMINTGNYLIPTMNGELRLEKPPLPTWIAAGIEHAFPYNLAAQRAAAVDFIVAVSRAHHRAPASAVGERRHPGPVGSRSRSDGTAPAATPGRDRPVVALV